MKTRVKTLCPRLILPPTTPAPELEKHKKVVASEEPVREFTRFVPVVTDETTINEGAERDRGRDLMVANKVAKLSAPEP